MITFNRACRQARGCKQLSTRRWLSQSIVDRLREPVQSYISTSRDPYLNLSIEHFLLQESAPESTILFLYINRPSIIIGRNQNPWLEVDLGLLDGKANSSRGLGPIDLVRRRSGGGTVFHDEGNVNWMVICPPKDFTRDKHAEMVVQALRSRGVDRSRVNERHDIVMDQGKPVADCDLDDDTHSTRYTRFEDGATIRPLKVSGSAYKLTRQRALHHGTCLLSSPNLSVIPDYLHSPAKPYITARGVESVSSPVGNILLSSDDFVDSVRRAFAGRYGRVDNVEVSEDWLDHGPVRKGYEELNSRDWTFLQTPQFTISTKGDPSAIADLELTVRNGTLSDGHLIRRGSSAEVMALNEGCKGLKVHEIESWWKAVGRLFVGLTEAERHRLGDWMQIMLPTYDGMFEYSAKRSRRPSSLVR